MPDPNDEQRINVNGIEMRNSMELLRAYGQALRRGFGAIIARPLSWPIIDALCRLAESEERSRTNRQSKKKSKGRE